MFWIDCSSSHVGQKVMRLLAWGWLVGYLCKPDFEIVLLTRKGQDTYKSNNNEKQHVGTPVKIVASVFWGKWTVGLELSGVMCFLPYCPLVPDNCCLWVWICVIRNKCVNSYVPLACVEGSARASAVLTLMTGNEREAARNSAFHSGMLGMINSSEQSMF